MIWVPIDDHHRWRFLVGCSPRPVGDEAPSGLPAMSIKPSTYKFDDGIVIDTYLSDFNKENLYGPDREKQRTVNYTGMTAIPTQDQAMNEGMGYIANRSREHLATSDVAIIRPRHPLLTLVGDMQLGIKPTLPQYLKYYRVKPLDVDASHAELTDLLEAHVDDVRIPKGEPVY
jgi:hypothetical protein